jgi:hypothetical protein
VQRASQLAAHQCGLGVPGLVERARVGRDDGVDGRVHGGDAVEVGAGHLDRGHLASPDAAGELGGVQVAEIGVGRAHHGISLRSAGITSEANSSMLFIVFSGARLPIWKMHVMIPQPAALMESFMRSRTVAGLP